MPAADLHAAILADDAAAATMALAAGAPLTDDTPPLVTASSRKAKAVMAVLIDRGADPNDPGAFDLAPLHVVRDAASVRLLVAAGADLEQRCAGGTPLRMAAANASPAVIKALLAAGADPDATRPPHDQRPLEVAVRLRRSAAIAALLTRPPAPEAIALAVLQLLPRPSGDRMPTRKAKDRKALDVLLAARPDLNAVFPGTTQRLVHLLAVRTDKALASAVLAAGPDIDARGPGDVTGLFLAATRAAAGSTRALGVAQAFIAAGADAKVVCTQDPTGRNSGRCAADLLADLL